MTYAQIYAAVQALRFDSSILSTSGGIKDWIRAREGEVWQYTDWPIKDSALLNLTVVNGTATIALPAGFSFPAQALEILDENGYKLDYVPAAEFFHRYQPYNVPSVSKGPADAWTFTTDISGTPAVQIRVGPTPDANRTYTVYGWSLPISRSAAATYKAGTMSADTDLPWWPDDYHYFLVSGALALGKRQYNDPTWQADEQDFQAGLQRLAMEVAPIRETVQAGRWGEC